MQAAIRGLKQSAAACAALLAIAAISGCNRTAEATTQPDPVPVVPVVKVARANLSTDIKLTAEFEAYQEVDVLAKVAGYVSSIRVDIGDRVAEGALLATLEIPELRNELTKTAANIQATEADIAVARDQLRRDEEAHEAAHLAFSRINQVNEREKGLVPQQQLDEVHSRDLMAESQIAAAKSLLGAAQQRAAVARAEEARAKTMLDYANIAAPFAGVITKRYANKGSMIQAGTASQSQAMPLVRLAQNNVLRLVLPVPESAVSRVRRGSNLEVLVPSLHRTFSGHVTRTAQTVQAATRTMDTQVDVSNPDFILVPGMYAEVNLRLEEHQDVLTVPVDSVDASAGTPHVLLASPDGKLRSTAVTTGLENAQRVEIRSGLQDGDLIVVGRQAGLKDGQIVKTKIADFAGH